MAVEQSPGPSHSRPRRSATVRRVLDRCGRIVIMVLRGSRRDWVLPWIGGAALVVAAVLTIRVWWLAAPLERQESYRQELTGFATLWWAPLSASLLGMAALSGWLGRLVVRRRTAVHQAVAPAEPPQQRPGWSNAVSALAAAVTVLVAVAAMLYTNAANRDQAYLTEQGQITQRFTAAVEQLGQPGREHVDLRLGGIYALQRIMRDSPKDQPAVVEILAAFIRVHARRPTSVHGCAALEAIPVDPPPVDIQAALTVLLHRDIGYDGPTAVDLHRTRLPRADFYGMNVVSVDLSCADLRKANLGHVELYGAELRAADLRGAMMMFFTAIAEPGDWSDLTGADLRGACLAAATLPSASLEGVRLDGADLSAAELSGHKEFPAGVIRGVWTDEDTNLPPQAGAVPATSGTSPCGVS